MEHGLIVLFENRYYAMFVEFLYWGRDLWGLKFPGEYGNKSEHYWAGPDVLVWNA